MDGGKEPGITYCYDSRGNQIQETNSLGEVVKEKCYNAANRPVAESEGMGNGTEFTYLPDGQMESVSRGNGSKKSRSRVTWLSDVPLELEMSCIERRWQRLSMASIIFCLSG